MTVPIDIIVAQAYLKADGDDNDLITSQIASATTMCEDYCNRKFYADQAASDADFTVALADRSTAIAARTAALAALRATENADTDRSWQHLSQYTETRRLINDRYGSVLAAIKGRINGIVLDDAINAAILMTLGHLYINREDNLATGNNVVQVPVGAQRILQSKLWIGDLTDTAETCFDHMHCLISGS
jgi:hypothetical protein